MGEVSSSSVLDVLDVPFWNQGQKRHIATVAQHGTSMLSEV
jgi:hypothetical protein